MSFDASDSTDTDGSIQSYEWDFGDGNDATGESVTHSYDSAGTHTVELTVTDDDGATDSITADVTVTEANQAPSIDLFEITDESNTGTPANQRYARFMVDWEVSDDSGLDNVEITMTRSGTEVESETESLSGTSESGSATLQEDGNHNNDQYVIVITVEDEDGETTTQSETVTVG